MKVFTKPEDAELEQEGVWIPYGQGAEFLIARTGTHHQVCRQGPFRVQLDVVRMTAGMKEIG